METNQDYRLSEEVRNFIVEEKQKKVPPSKIKSDILTKFNRSVSYSSIRNTWQRYLLTGSIAYQQPAGRLRVLSEREERSLARDFIVHPGTSIKSTVKHQD